MSVATMKEKAKVEVERPELVSEDVRAKFELTAAELGQALVERDDEIAISLNALVAGEHVFLKGAPGEAKSLLLDSVANWMRVQKFFVLLNGQSTLSDIFGPVSISALKNDIHLRNTRGKLPEAEVAFIDEPFRGNSAVRNAMLRIMNERHYERGDGTFGTVPLKFLVAASNDWPKLEDEAEAFFDRFLYRREVKNVVSGSGLGKLLWPKTSTADHIPQLTTVLTRDELELARSQALELPWSPDAMEAFTSIVHDCHKAGVYPSGRRLVKSKKACSAAAWLEGSSSVDSEHLAILAHTLWVEPTEHPAAVGGIVLKYANPKTLKVNTLVAEADQIVTGLKADDFVAAKSAVAKLREIELKLSGMSTSEKAREAAVKVRAQIKQIRASVVDAK